MSKELTAQQPQAVSLSTHFVNKVLTELSGSVKVDWNEEQRRLAQGYYMGIERSLQAAEERRNTAKNTVPFNWKNTVIDSDLAQKIATNVRFGLDMRIDNNLFVVPRMDNKVGKYRLSFMVGYEGRKLIAKKYSLDSLVDIKDELVYASDKFSIVKKDATHDVESYNFEITNPFDRGELIGGFCYVQFEDASKNFVYVMSKKDIEKHKAKALTANIWNEWYDLMARKTIIHAACKKISIDPKKIDDAYREWERSETETAIDKSQETIKELANNGDVIDVVVEKEPCAQKSAIDVNEDFSADEIAEVIGDNSAKTPF